MPDQERPFVIVDGQKYVLEGAEMSSIPSRPKRDSEPFAQLSAPPRSVSFSARFLLLFGGGFLGGGTWFIACFGMIFCIVFHPMALTGFQDVWYRNFESAGKSSVLRVETTSSTVNGSRVIRIVFRDAQGNEHQCYSHAKRFQEGDAVDLLRYGDRLKIADTRLSPLGALSLLFSFVVIFPAMGLGFVLPAFFLGLKSLQLLQHGTIGRGKLLDMIPTGTRINNQYLIKFRYKFTADDGEEYEATAKSLEEVRLSDDLLEPLLSDPRNPKRSILLDSFPGKIRYDEMKQVFTANPLRIVLPLFFMIVFCAEMVAFLATLSGFWTIV